MSNDLPDATVGRLPIYLRVLVDLADRGVSTVSSEGLGRAAGVNPAQVRKDLSHLGSYGVRGVGYEVEELLGHVTHVLGLTREWRVVLVGIGNLGRALASYASFEERGFSIAALVDADDELVGDEVAGRVVESVTDLDRIVAREQASIGVLAVPAVAAQGVADALVDAGVTALLNFAPVHVEVPAHVHIRRVDVSTELQILAYHAEHGAAVEDDEVAVDHATAEG